MAVVQQCLSNVSTQRPEISALFDRVNTILSALPQQFTDRVEMLKQLQTLTDIKQSQIGSLTRGKQSEIEYLRAEVERLSVQSPSQQAHSHSSHTRDSDIQTQVNREGA